MWSSSTDLPPGYTSFSLCPVIYCVHQKRSTETLDAGIRSSIEVHVSGETLDPDFLRCYANRQRTADTCTNEPMCIPSSRCDRNLSECYWHCPPLSIFPYTASLPTFRRIAIQRWRRGPHVLSSLSGDTTESRDGPCHVPVLTCRGTNIRLNTKTQSVYLLHPISLTGALSLVGGGVSSHWVAEYNWLLF